MSPGPWTQVAMTLVSLPVKREQDFPMVLLALVYDVCVLPAVVGYRTSPQIRTLRSRPFWPQPWPSPWTWCGLARARPCAKARVTGGPLGRMTEPSRPSVSLSEQQAAACPQPRSSSCPSSETLLLCWCLGPKGDWAGESVDRRPLAWASEPPSVTTPQWRGLSCSRWGATEAAHSQSAWPATGAFLAAGPEGSACRVFQDRSEAQALPAAESHSQGECT